MCDLKQSELAEAQLIREVKAGQDEALLRLYQRYRPLINNIKRKYHIRSYDSQDWNQEALIICHASALSYDANKGKFGSYYKTRLANHAKTMLRYEAAYRRRALTESLSLEAAVENGLRLWQPAMIQLAQTPLTDNLTAVLENLSLLELDALLVALGVLSSNEVLQKLGIEQQALQRARSRVKQKMRQALLS